MAMQERLSRVQKKGQITIPAEIRQRWDLQEGDLVAFADTEEGIVISPQTIVPTQTLNKVTKALASQEGSGSILAPDGPDLVTFLREYTAKAESVDTDKALSVVEKTFGAFKTEEHPPADFDSLREDFIDYLGTESKSDD